MEAADLVDVGAAAARDAYWRDGSRRAPYNLYASPEQLRSKAAAVDVTGSRTPPAPLFPYRARGETLVGPGIVPTRAYLARGGYIGVLTTSIRWDWDEPSGTWRRTQDGSRHVETDGTQVSATNVIIRSTPYRDSGVRDSVGAVVPEAALVGEGEAWLLSGGQAQPGRWHKPSPAAPTTYTALNGSPLLLAPGPTWIEVLPPDAVTLL